MNTVNWIKMRWFLPVLTLLSTAQTGFGQDNAVDGLVKQFDQYKIHAISEKLFAHTDRSFYSAGEIIWFKLYVVDGYFNKPLDVSKVAYVEILSRDMKPILQAKVALKDGSGEGSFLVPFSVPSGNYIFRAYTSWMKNFSPEFYFDKQVNIVNSLRKPDWQSTATTSSFDVQFFPEGGDLVKGFQSKVGVRVVDQYGLGKDCRAVVINQNKDTVARFQTLKFGLGQFLITPVSGQSYTALIKIGDSTVVSQPLPAVRENGYVMGLSEPDKDHILVTVSSNAAGVDGLVYLFVHTRQMGRIAEAKSLSGDKTTFLVDKSKLEEGIAHFTILNASRQPVCERLFFKRPVKKWNLNVNADKSEYGLRQKVDLSLTSSSTASLPVPADLSIAVFLLDSLQSVDPVDIQSYLMLSSDLKGRIESPQYYLNDASPDLDIATDNLMLTHGWSRFRWEELLQDKRPAFEYLPEYDGHIIYGRITDRRTGQPVPNTTTYLSVPGEKFIMDISTSNQKGELRFDLKNFYGAGEIVAQTNTKADSIYRIDILNPYSEKYSSRILAPFDLPENRASQLLYRSTHAQVENNFLEDKKQRFTIPASLDSFAFYGRPDKKYFLDDYTRFLTMEEVMREYIQEVRVRKLRDHFHFMVADPAHGYFFENDPMVLLDGIPVFDIDKIIAFDPLKIKKLEVITRRYFLDSLVNEGIVSYTTYHGNLAGFQLDPNALLLEYPGLQLDREFFSPVYESSDAAGSRIPDFRNLLFWSPNLLADASGKKTVPFYTSDIPGHYAIVVQGIGAGGLAGSAVSYFTVKR